MMFELSGKTTKQCMMPGMTGKTTKEWMMGGGWRRIGQLFESLNERRKFCFDFE